MANLERATAMDLMSIQSFSVDQRVSNVSLTLQQGEVLGLIGPNGAGKSTLLNAIGGLLDSSGEIELSGQNIDQLSRVERARKVALQPQFVESVWALSVHDIVSMGRLPWGDSDQKIIHRVMQQTKIQDFAQRHVNELSGGERARVWLARVLANQPRVLLVDEPVANLDIHYQQEVMQILVDYANEGHAVIIAIHDLSLAARYCDRLCLLHRGQQIKTGKVEAVLNSQVLSPVFDVDVYVDLQNSPPVVLAQ
ncbi:MAG: iron complex transport system ATP-binding protein [Gammaproteobacteria bacterium]|jgi:iron complex transport system ATP-binding protein